MGHNLLIIGHNCLSKTGSNGRTLGNYLQGWNSQNLAQLYIHPEQPDFSICQNFFCIGDHDIIDSILKRKSAGKKIKQNNLKCEQAGIVTAKHSRKNSIIFLLREIAWNSPFWKSSALNDWIEDFNPDAILFQAGDAGFLFRLVVKISKKYNIPIIMYNTEGYYFKKVSYMSENRFSNLFYPILHRYFCNEYKKLMKYTKLAIYLGDMLMNDYKKVFEHNACVIMNTSEFADQEIKNQDYDHHIVYAGNVEVGRYKSIIELAEAAHSIDETLYVDLYTLFKDEAIKKRLEQCSAIRLKGYVPYEKLQAILKSSEYLLAVENFTSFYCEDSKYAFSTKIADSLASGGCFIVYAPENIAVSQYLKDKNAAVLITNSDDLLPCLKKVFTDSEYRELVRNNSRRLAVENHSMKKNKVKFQQLIREVIENENITG